MQLLPRHDLTGILNQHGQDLNGLIGNSDFDSVAAQLTGAQIQLKRTKADETNRASHAHGNSWRKSLAYTHFRSFVFNHLICHINVAQIPPATVSDRRLASLKVALTTQTVEEAQMGGFREVSVLFLICVHSWSAEKLERRNEVVSRKRYRSFESW